MPVQFITDITDQIKIKIKKSVWNILSLNSAEKKKE